MDSLGKYFIQWKLKICTLPNTKVWPTTAHNFSSSWPNESLCQRTHKHKTQLRGKREFTGREIRRVTLLISDPFTAFFLLHSIKKPKISDGFHWFFQVNRLGTWIFPFLWGFLFSSLFCASLSHCSVFPRQICLWGISLFPLSLPFVFHFCIFQSLDWFSWFPWLNWDLIDRWPG